MPWCGRNRFNHLSHCGISQAQRQDLRCYAFARPENALQVRLAGLLITADDDIAGRNVLDWFDLDTAPVCC